MFARKGRVLIRLPSGHLPAGRHLATLRTVKAGFLVLSTAVFLTGCPLRIARVPVKAESIIRANEAVREGDLAFARREFYPALIKYLEASRLNPNSEYIFNKLGITYSQLKYYSEATDAFVRSIGLNPKYPYAYNNLGSVYFAINDKRKAERYFKKALSLKEDVASFHLNLGTLYFETRKLEKAMQEWRRGLSLDRSIFNRAESISLVAATGSGPSSEKSYRMARLFASMGDVDKALENLQQALNAGFTDIETLRKEPDFDPIRQDPKFVAFMRTATLLTRP